MTKITLLYFNIIKKKNTFETINNIKKNSLMRTTKLLFVILLTTFLFSCRNESITEESASTENLASEVKTDLTEIEQTKRSMAIEIGKLMASDQNLEKTILEEAKNSKEKYIGLSKISAKNKNVKSLTSRIDPIDEDDLELYLPYEDYYYGATGLYYDENAYTEGRYLYITYSVDDTDTNTVYVYDRINLGKFVKTMVVNDDYLDTNPIYVIDDSADASDINPLATSPSYINDNVNYSDYAGKIIQVEIPEVRMNGKDYVKSFGFKKQTYKLYRTSVPVSGTVASADSYMIKQFSLKRRQIKKKKWVTVNATYSADINEIGRLHYLHIFSLKGRNWRNINSKVTTTLTYTMNNGQLTTTANTLIDPGDNWVHRASQELSSNSIFAYNVNPITGDEARTNGGVNYLVRNVGALSFYFKLKQLTY